MKKSLFLLLSLGIFVTSFAQNNYKKSPSLSVNFTLTDFQTAADLRSSGLSNVIKDKQWTKLKRMNPGAAISYIEGLGNYIDFVGSLAGSFGSYPVPNKESNEDDGFLLEGVASANLKLLSDKYVFSPYLTLGVGASKYKNYYGAFIPAGLGLQFNLQRGTSIVVNSQYRIPVTENVAYHLYHSVGFVSSIKKRADISEPAKVDVPASNP